jgi:tetratricopeptide (TPR) repeat protein
MAVEHFLLQPERKLMEQMKDEYDYAIAKRIRDKETGRYLSKATHFERKKKYEEALENYHECYELLPNEFYRSIDYGRVHYFMGNKLRSAKIYAYFLVDFRNKYYSQRIRRFEDGLDVLKKYQFYAYREGYQKIEFYVLSNQWKLQQPFTTFDELIRFLERSRRKIPSDLNYDGVFEEAITYLRELQEWHKEYEKWLKENHYPEWKPPKDGSYYDHSYTPYNEKIRH